MKLLPHIWLTQDAIGAAEWYCSLIPNSKINWTYWLKDTPSGDCDLVSFTLAGKEIGAIGAGDYFKLNESISFMLNCPSKEAIDQLYAALMEGGVTLMPLGEYPFNPYYVWLRDKNGLTWQLMLDAELHDDYSLDICLLFQEQRVGQALPALTYYGQVFGSQVEDISYYQAGEAADERAKINYARLTLGEMNLIGMDHGYTGVCDFNEALSIMVYCDSQEEIDTYWQALSHVPEAEACGWCKDLFGVSWQILPQWLMDQYDVATPAQNEAVGKVLMQMKKLDLAALQDAKESVN